MLQAFAPAELVIDQSDVDVYNPETERGYQRAAVRARMRAAAAYYEKGGRMPNPLLINIREEDFERVHVEVTNADPKEYNRAVREGGNWIGSGFIEFEPDVPLWIYDGQHREGGIEQLRERQALAGDFPVPLSLTLGLNTASEMREFYEVNTNAVSVKTDLAWQLLTKMAQDDPNLQELLAADDKDWITRGHSVVRALEKLDGPWSGRFREANQRKRKGDSRNTPKPQFIRSLKPVLDMPLLKRADADTIASIINAYWTGISRVLPEPFEQDPTDFVIQKGQGMVALHRVLPQVIEVIRAHGQRLGDPEPYAEVMQDLPTLSGEAIGGDGETVTRTGAEFWRVGSVASAFGGDAGRRRLGLLIQTKIPIPADTITL
jgi:DGQHR domain-containing protein